MERIKKMFLRFRRSEKGQGMMEYGLVLTLVSVVAIGALNGIGNKLDLNFNKISTEYPELRADFVKSATVAPYALAERNLVKDKVDSLDLNTVNVPIRVLVEGATSNTMSLHPDDMANAKELIEELNDMDVDVILEPYPWIATGSIGETEWNPSDINTWFWNWKTVVLKPMIDQIATPYNVSALTVSNNFPHMEYAEGYWKDTFKDVKTTYGYNGEVIYKTNWWITASWDINTVNNYNAHLNNPLFGSQYLDTISVAAYFELTDTPNPTVDEIKTTLSNTTKFNREQNVFQELKNFSDKWGKTIYFGELGVPNRSGYASEPWNPSPTGFGNKTNKDAQYNFYRAYVETFGGQGWFKGFSLFAIGDINSEYNITSPKAIDYIAGLH